MNNKKLVSIVMPAYNCEKYIGIAIESVINQIYLNWELIIIDDCSTDNTGNVCKDYQKKDSRIKYYALKKNSGAAVARNKAVEIANGNYIAFLDSDDVWFSNKLSRQINFMEQNDYAFTCTCYTKIDSNGDYIDKTVNVRKKSNYNNILKNNPGNSTVIYDADKIGKTIIPNIRKRNDYIMWLNVVKKTAFLYGLDEVLSSHRVRNGSLSNKKADLVKYHWKVYREIESLSFIKSSYLIVYWVTKTLFKLKRIT